jgi:hypothetical protein
MEALTRALIDAALACEGDITWRIGCMRRRSSFARPIGGRRHSLPRSGVGPGWAVPEWALSTLQAHRHRGRSEPSPKRKRGNVASMPGPLRLSSFALPW